MFLLNFHVGCRQNHVWRPPGAQVMSIFVNTYIFLERLIWARPMVEKSVNNYIEWCSQNTKRLNFGQHYEDIIVISYYVLMIFLIIYVSYLTILCCIVLYYTLLYYAMHLFTVLYCSILYYTVIHRV